MTNVVTSNDGTSSSGTFFVTLFISIYQMLHDSLRTIDDESDCDALFSASF